MILPTIFITSLFYWIPCYWDKQWLYIPKENIIYICKDYENHQKILLHEIWHFVWFNILDNTERDYFKNIFNTCDIQKKCFVWWYSMKSQEEDFAETFSFFYFKNDSKEETINLKLDFMKNIFDKYRISQAKKKESEKIEILSYE